MGAEEWQRRHVMFQARDAKHSGVGTGKVQRITPGLRPRNPPSNLLNGVSALGLLTRLLLFPDHLGCGSDRKVFKLCSRLQLFSQPDRLHASSSPRIT